MNAEIIAALIGGLFVIVAALAPWLLRKLEERRGRPPSVFPKAEGLSAVVGIVQRGHDVLLVQRVKRIENLSWQFPAGVLDPGENIQDTVEETLLRETGIRCKSKSYIGARVPTSTGVLCHYVHCLYLEGEAANLTPKDNAQVAWVPVSAVGDYITSDLYSGVRRLLNEINSGAGMPKVVLGVVMKGNHVLLVRKRHSDSGSEWQLPGGEIDGREREKRAVEREVLEEAGIQCAPDRKIGERVHPLQGALLSYWHCLYKKGDIRIGEPRIFSDIAWVPAPRALELLGDTLFGPVRVLLEQY